MIFYVDADNCYKTRINGIKALTSNDKVIIYYNGNNDLFKKKSVEELKNKFNCICDIEVRKVKNVSQAVDFTIAIDISNNNSDELIYIIGDDKHLDSISQIIDKPNVSAAACIRECLIGKICEIDDISEYVEFVGRFLPKNKARLAIKNQIKMSINLNKCAEELYKKCKI